MRTLTMFNRISADGYFATPDGKIDWVIPEPAIDAENASNTGGGTSTMLFGRRTYEMFESFWPKVGDGKSVPSPHGPMPATPELLAYARTINAAKKVVYSKSRSEVTWNNSHLRREIDADEIRALKREPGGALLIFGSGSIVSQLTDLRLIDEYQFVVSPLFLGSGKSVTERITSRAKLELIEVKSYPSGTLRIRYAPAR